MMRKVQIGARFATEVVLWAKMQGPAVSSESENYVVTSYHFFHSFPDFADWYGWHSSSSRLARDFLS